MGAVLDPQQELFAAVKLSIEAKGYSVFDGFLPPDGTPYPFVYLGDCQQIDEETKSTVRGNVYLTIHVFSDNPKRRGTLSAILHDIKTACREIGKTDNFGWMLRNVTQRIFPDNTTKTPLLHAVLEVEYKFS